MACMGWKFNYGVHNIMKGAAEKGQFLSHLSQGLFDIYCDIYLTFIVNYFVK